MADERSCVYNHYRDHAALQAFTHTTSASANYFSEPTNISFPKDLPIHDPDYFDNFEHLQHEFSTDFLNFNDSLDSSSRSPSRCIDSEILSALPDAVTLCDESTKLQSSTQYSHQELSNAQFSSFMDVASLTEKIFLSTPDTELTDAPWLNYNDVSSKKLAICQYSNTSDESPRTQSLGALQSHSPFISDDQEMAAISLDANSNSFDFTEMPSLIEFPNSNIKTSAIFKIDQSDCTKSHDADITEMQTLSTSSKDGNGGSKISASTFSSFSAGGLDQNKSFMQTVSNHYSDSTTASLEHSETNSDENSLSSMSTKKRCKTTSRTTAHNECFGPQFFKVKPNSEYIQDNLGSYSSNYVSVSNNTANCIEKSSKIGSKLIQISQDSESDQSLSMPLNNSDSARHRSTQVSSKRIMQVSPNGLRTRGRPRNNSKIMSTKKAKRSSTCFLQPNSISGAFGQNSNQSFLHPNPIMRTQPQLFPKPCYEVPTTMQNDSYIPYDYFSYRDLPIQTTALNQISNDAPCSSISDCRLVLLQNHPSYSNKLQYLEARNNFFDLSNAHDYCAPCKDVYLHSNTTCCNLSQFEDHHLSTSIFSHPLTQECNDENYDNAFSHWSNNYSQLYNKHDNQPLNLLNISQQDWNYLKNSKSFKLGDKGRAMLKSRISKHLRENPHKRATAASISGVRCATIKQLFQLAQLCELHDVLPPILNMYLPSNRIYYNAVSHNDIASDNHHLNGIGYHEGCNQINGRLSIGQSPSYQHTNGGWILNTTQIPNVPSTSHSRLPVSNMQPIIQNCNSNRQGEMRIHCPIQSQQKNKIAETKSKSNIDCKVEESCNPSIIVTSEDMTTSASVDNADHNSDYFSMNFLQQNKSNFT